MRFRLGYVAAPVAGHEHLEGRLVIPYLSRAGVVGMKFRRLTDDENAGPKYLFQSGSTSKRIFNPEALFREDRTLYICEGEIDAITIDQCGMAGIAIPGVKCWEPFMARALRGYDRVFVLGDADDKKEEGRKFADMVADEVENARVLMMPSGFDVNSFFTEFGADALRDKVGVSSD